jgi:hypothetical protein
MGQEKTMDFIDALILEHIKDFAKNTGGTLVSPPVPTWRRGDGIQSVTLDHVILINFQDNKATTVVEALGDIQHDHLCLSVDLDLTVFGEWAPGTPPTVPKGPRLESNTCSHIKSQMDLKTAVFNTDIEGKIMDGRMGASEAVEQTLQNKLSTVILLLTEEHQRVNTKEVKCGPHRDREQRERLREITTLALTTFATENANVVSIEKSEYDLTRIRGRSTNEDLVRTEHGPSCPACSEMVGMENVRGGRHRPGAIQK